ncbi:hemerythrin domain-containing protein [Arthrobacter sp. BB-1]|uniref:hemerythrin domain-containing protein n=1 Tax=unclassified Arthrobacter TaxID=235627 RepID=UPI0011120F31|nr:MULTISPECIES: hemerythrin domain-containing protein [unclassified Arthrobacter]TNB72114.1 hemerythrin domain-containing protein [Arthrobacter sp. BB-1]
MNQPKDAASEAQALQAVERHHSHMLKQLNGLVALLMEAVEAGDSGAEGTAQATLLDWCDSELIPHALAEEGPLYSGGTPEGRLLVEGMLAEHRVIVDLVEELRTSSGLSAVVAGAAIQRMFAMHLDKENRLLMPFIADSPGLSLAEAVKGLHELTGEGSGHHAEAHDGGAHQR